MKNCMILITFLILAWTGAGCYSDEVTVDHDTTILPDAGGDILPADTAVADDDTVITSDTKADTSTVDTAIADTEVADITDIKQKDTTVPVDTLPADLPPDQEDDVPPPVDTSVDADDLPEGKCQRYEDCEPQQYCAKPDDPSPCGICFNEPDACQVDSDCDDYPAMVCETMGMEVCACEPFNMCITACQEDSQCKLGKSCNQGHCVMTLCAADSDCPPLFSCAGAGENAYCQRKSCVDDTQCGGAYCVLGYCYDVLGTCQYMVP